MGASNDDWGIPASNMTKKKRENLGVALEVRGDGRGEVGHVLRCLSPRRVVGRPGAGWRRGLGRREGKGAASLGDARVLGGPCVYRALRGLRKEPDAGGPGTAGMGAGGGDSGGKRRGGNRGPEGGGTGNEVLQGDLQ